MSHVMYRVLTELTVVVHLLFIAFVVGGSFLSRRHRWLIPIHVIALAWAAYAEISPGVVCPLTALENLTAQHAGLATYRGDFVTRYLVPIIYQDGLSQRWQYCLVMAVLGINAFGYRTLARRLPDHSQDPTSSPVTPPAGQEPRRL